MSDDLPHKSHAMTWIVSVLVVLLLYAATWPLVEIKASLNIKTSVTLSPGGLQKGILRLTPAWIDVLYRPMHFLSDAHSRSNPAARYFDWWSSVLE
jgi:hypothetical protein